MILSKRGGRIPHTLSPLRGSVWRCGGGLRPVADSAEHSASRACACGRKLGGAGESFPRSFVLERSISYERNFVSNGPLCVTAKDGVSLSGVAFPEQPYIMDVREGSFPGNGFPQGSRRIGSLGDGVFSCRGLDGSPAKDVRCPRPGRRSRSRNTEGMIDHEKAGGSGCGADADIPVRYR